MIFWSSLRKLNKHLINSSNQRLYNLPSSLITLTSQSLFIFTLSHHQHHSHLITNTNSQTKPLLLLHPSLASHPSCPQTHHHHHHQQQNFHSSSLSMSIPQPPQPPPRWNHSASEIESIVNDTIHQSRSLLDRIAALSKDQATFQSVIIPLAENDAALARGGMLVGPCH